MSLVDAMDGKVEPHGREEIPFIDSTFVFPSYHGVVQIGQLLFQFGVEEVEVILGGVPMVDKRAEELAWVLLHGGDGDFVTFGVLKVEPDIFNCPSLNGEGSALTGFVGEAHCSCLVLGFIHQSLMFLFVNGDLFKIISEGLSDGFAIA